MLGVAVRVDTRWWGLATNVILPGVYAWLTTVLHPARQHGVSGAATASAVLALGCLVLGTVLAGPRPGWARSVGVVGFVVLCVTTWVLCGEALDVSLQSPLRAACGGVGWIVFAFGWGALARHRVMQQTSEQPSEARLLDPRAKPPWPAVLTVAAGVMAALLPGWLAWQVTRRDHALLAHGAALAASLAVVVVAGRVATEREPGLVSAAPRERLRAAGGTLTLLALLLTLGLVYRWLD